MSISRVRLSRRRRKNHLKRTILERLRTFSHDTRGSVVLSLALVAIPLVAAVGAAVDYSRAVEAKTAMQGALDSTALALAKQIITGATPTDAKQQFSGILGNPGIKDVSVSSDVSTANGGTTVALTATGAIDADFMQLLNYSTLPIRTNSTAYAKADHSGCVLALNTEAGDAVSFGGSTAVNLNNCSVYSNSDSSTSVDASGSSTLSALSVGAVGGISASSSNVDVSEGINPHLSAITNPYADMVVPAHNSDCTNTNLNVRTTATIDPGTYCNGITVNAGANLTLNPGVYYIDRGTFSVNGGATITGTGVTLIFTSSTGKNWAGMTINGNATVDLTAPNFGPTAGLVLFGDPNMPVGTSFKLNGGSSQVFGGAVYVPSGAIDYSGGAATSTSCTQIIGDTVSFSGNSNVAIDCSNYDTRPFGSIIVRLIS